MMKRPGRYASVEGPTARTDSHLERGAAGSDARLGPRQKSPWRSAGEGTLTDYDNRRGVGPA
jgi:hypothetical protein